MSAWGIAGDVEGNKDQQIQDNIYSNKDLNGQNITNNIENTGF